MIQSGNVTCKTHYEILDVKEDASFEEIRTCYRTAILSFHPDKMQMTCETSKANESGSRFLEVQRAWEILGDSKSRALYDNDLQSLRQDSATAEDIRLEDMSIEDAGDLLELLYDCRCGDYFIIDSSELADMGYPLMKNGSEFFLQTPKSLLPVSVVLPCGSCSLKVRLLINAPLMKNGSEFFLQTPKSLLPVSVVLPCGSCSLKVRLLINADSKLQTESSNQ